MSPPWAHSLVRIRPGHVHHGDRGLDVPIANAICATNIGLSIPASPIRKWSWRCPRVSTRVTGLPTCVSLPLGCSSRPFMHFRGDPYRLRWNPVGVTRCFKDPLGKKWRWFHVSPNLGRSPKGFACDFVCEANVCSIHAGACLGPVLSRQRLSLRFLRSKSLNVAHPPKRTMPSG